MNEPLPAVSILVAARNEAKTLPDCLRALAALDYPPERLQILIGDDASTDGTSSVVKAFIQDKPFFSLLPITRSLPGLNGKASVLAQLAEHATGTILFTTDADARVSPGWLRAMLKQFTAAPTGQASIGVVGGCTTIEGKTLWARVQALECILVFQLLALSARMGRPLTVAGNNMAFRREAYRAVGGFEGLPFSLVEDYTLFQAIVGKGYGFRQTMDPDALVTMLPPPGLRAYFQQRKRWMEGVFSLPLPWRLLSLSQYLLAPLLLGLAFWLPGPALSLYLLKVLGQTLLLWRGLIRLQQPRYWPGLLLYEPYQTLFGLLAFGYYWLPTGLVWKGRNYA